MQAPGRRGEMGCMETDPPLPTVSQPHDPERWPRTTQTLPPAPRYRVRISLHLHEGGIFEEPQPGGGDGAVLPHGHRGSSGGEWGQGLVTWEDEMDPGLHGVLCGYTQTPPPAQGLCASWKTAPRLDGNTGWILTPLPGVLVQCGARTPVCCGLSNVPQWVSACVTVNVCPNRKYKASEKADLENELMVAEGKG